MKLKTKIAAVLTLTAVTGAAFAQQALKPEEMIKFRKAGYSFMSWNMGKIKAQVSMRRRASTRIRCWQLPD